MPKSTVEEEKVVLLPKDQHLPAELVSVTEEHVEGGISKRTGKEYDAFTNWSWEFRITDGEFAGLRAWAKTEGRVSTHPNNRPRLFAEALLGAEFEIGMDFDTDDVIGLPCELVVTHQTYETRDGETKTRTPVTQLVPVGTTDNIVGEPGF